MTRLEMQERIGTGPYSVEYEEDPCDDNNPFGYVLCDAYGHMLVEPSYGDFLANMTIEDGAAKLQAICDALNALWESAE